MIGRALIAGAIFMFPGILAEGPFSLRQGEACCALSFSMELTPEGELTSYSASASRIVPARRMTYDEVDAAVEGAAGELSPDLQALLKVRGMPPWLLCSADIHAGHRSATPDTLLASVCAR
jgi:exoribonuclease R